MACLFLPTQSSSAVFFAGARSGISSSRRRRRTTRFAMNTAAAATTVASRSNDCFPISRVRLSSAPTMAYLFLPTQSSSAVFFAGARSGISSSRRRRWTTRFAMNTAAAATTVASRSNDCFPISRVRLSSAPTMAYLFLPTQSSSAVLFAGARSGISSSRRRRRTTRFAMNTAAAATTVASRSNDCFPIMVNGCAGKMGKAVAEAAVAAGLQLVPASFGSLTEAGQEVRVGNTEVQLHGPPEKEYALSSILDKYPNVIVVDFTVPDAVNPNAELYCRVGVPFVMGTTGGDREMLYKTVEDSNVYAVISPQMGKQVVAFLAAMEIMADQFPGAFSSYSLQVVESHQASKLDTSGTAKAIISCFKKLGVSFELDQIQQIRDPKKQLEVVGVPEEYLSGHAFHLYHLTSPDKTVSFEFQHNVCGRSIYAEGSIDAAIFLFKKVQSNADKRIYNMIDVLREGNMR